MNGDRDTSTRIAAARQLNLIRQTQRLQPTHLLRLHRFAVTMRRIASRQLSTGPATAAATRINQAGSVSTEPASVGSPRQPRGESKSTTRIAPSLLRAPR